MKIHSNAMVEITNIVSHGIKVCHLKNIKEVTISPEGPSYIDGLPVSKKDAELMRDLLTNKILFKDAITDK